MLLTRVARWRRSFRSWRRGRPWSAAVLLVLSGVVILVPPYATFRLGSMTVSIQTIGGASALVIGAGQLAAAAVLLLRPRWRVAGGAAALVLSLVAVVTTNLGGFLVGSALGLVGGALAVSWTRQPRHGARNVTLCLMAGCLAVLPVSTARAAPERPVRTWTATAATLHVEQLAYVGVSSTDIGGRATPVLVFTVQSMDGTDLALSATLGNGHPLVMHAPAGQVRAGPAKLLVLHMAATLELLGPVGVPVAFSAALPPPIPFALPAASFRNVNILAAEAGGGVVTLPGSRAEVG